MLISAYDIASLVLEPGANAVVEDAVLDEVNGIVEILTSGGTPVVVWDVLAEVVGEGWDDIHRYRYIRMVRRSCSKKSLVYMSMGAMVVVLLYVDPLI